MSSSSGTNMLLKWAFGGLTSDLTAAGTTAVGELTGDLTAAGTAAVALAITAARRRQQAHDRTPAESSNELTDECVRAQTRVRVGMRVAAHAAP